MIPTQPQPRITVSQSSDYRENYSNSVQVRVSVWDFLLVFGLVHQESPEAVTIQNTQGIYLSPQQAKALWNILGQNIAQYEQAFGTIALEPQTPCQSRRVQCIEKQAFSFCCLKMAYFCVIFTGSVYGKDCESSAPVCCGFRRRTAGASSLAAPALLLGRGGVLHSCCV